MSYTLADFRALELTQDRARQDFNYAAKMAKYWSKRSKELAIGLVQCKKAIKKGEEKLIRKKFLTVKEVAEIFGISPQTVYRWIRDKGLKWCKVSVRGTRTRPVWLLEYLEEHNDLEGIIRVKNYLIPKDNYKVSPFESKEEQIK